MSSMLSIESIADAAAGSLMSNHHTAKRKADDAAGGEPELKFMKGESPSSPDDATTPSTPFTQMVAEALGASEEKQEPEPEAAKESATAAASPSKAREVRLEQNRKAARESRRRKKVMIEELQRSVIFFSRANGTLKNQNEELSRILVQAQAQVKAAASGAAAPVVNNEEPKPSPEATAPAVAEETRVVEPTPAAPVVQSPDPLPEEKQPGELSQQEQQAQAQAVATQALFETQGFPAAAARAAAQTMNASATGVHTAPSSLPQMQPGATMQAMANFQQAAAAAMQAAMQGMQAIPNINFAPMTAVPQAASAQQAYTDQMTALAMQQAAAAHMGHHMMNALPGTFMAQPFYAWPTAQGAQAMFQQQTQQLQQPQQQQQQQQQNLPESATIEEVKNEGPSSTTDNNATS